MERYSEYKDSGVQWLGEIPRHWELIKSKYLWKESFSISEKGNEALLSVSQYDGITPAKGNTRSETLDGYKIVEKDDLVINIMLAWMGGLGISSYNGIVSPAYCVYKLEQKYNPRFFHYLYKTPLYLSEFARHSTGVIPSRWRLYTDDFGRVLSLIPPIEEQDAIVAYLDKVTGKIDAAIAQQQKMIELLNERKQIINNNAVTKGLDPTAKMKPSGIPWLGNIPAHWRIVPIKRYATIKTGRTPSTTNNGYYEDGTFNWYTPGDIKTSKLWESGRKVTQRAIRDDACPLFPPYTVYLVGIGGTIGKVAYSEIEASCNQQINALIPNNKNLHYKYFTLFIQTSIIQVFHNANLSTLPIINQERTGSLLMSLPSFTEQKSIVKYIEEKIHPIDSYIQHVKEIIELLQERKLIIINNVVTGKVKVV